MSDYRDTLPKCQTCGAYLKMQDGEYEHFECGATYSHTLNKFVAACGNAPRLLAATTARAERAERALRETIQLAQVSFDGDSYYAEQASLDGDAILERACVTLAATEASAERA